MMARATNVIALPTAVRRRVDNNRFADQRRAAVKARKDSPFPKFRFPGHNEAVERAKAMRETEQTPALVICLMILETLPREVRQGMIEQLAMRAVFSPVFRQAVEAIRSTMLTVGQQLDTMRALDELNGEAR